jgi:LPXTG-motif cell wall-anchored protein
MKYGRMLAGAGALTAIGVLIAPGLASAHTANYSKDCDGLFVQVELYPDGTTIDVTIDNTPTQHFENGINKTFPWDPTKDHTFDIVVTDPNEPVWNRHWSGDQEKCVTPPPDSTTTTTTTPPPTTAPPTTTPPTEPTTPPTEPTVPPTEPTTPITQNLVTTTTRASSGGGSSSGGSSSSGSGNLPSTGPSDAVPFAAAGLAALAGGSALVFVARRRGNTPG